MSRLSTAARWSGSGQPKTPTKLVPVLREADTAKVLQACRGKGFVSLRDEALIRLYANTGARLSEVGNLLVTDVDMNTESVHFHGKGAKDRRVRFGPKTARAVSRYLRARDQHKGAQLPNLWLADRGAAPLTPNGIKIRLKRLGAAAGVPDVHAHRWRHSFAHEWKLAGGGHRRPDAAAGLDLGGHATPLRCQRRRGAGHGHAAAHRYRRTRIGGRPVRTGDAVPRRLSGWVGCRRCCRGG